MNWVACNETREVADDAAELWHIWRDTVVQNVFYEGKRRTNLFFTPASLPSLIINMEMLQNVAKFELTGIFTRPLFPVLVSHLDKQYTESRAQAQFIKSERLNNDWVCGFEVNILYQQYWPTV